MDGLDLVVGTVVSAAVAGLGAAVAAYLGSIVSRSVLFIAAIAWATGGTFMYGSYMMLSVLPEKADLIALEPSTVRDAYVDKGLNGDVLRLCGAGGACVTVSPRKDYYPDLVAAIHSPEFYRVLYARERGLFSRDNELYTVIYDVSVNGETLESFETRANQLTLFCYGTFVFGLVMFVGGFFALRFSGSTNTLD